MQKTSSVSKNVDNEIKIVSQRLKELIAAKKGITVQQLEIQNKNNKKYIRRKKINTDRFRDITFQFQCPNCKGYNTKRNGSTTQIEPKARILCYDCQLKRRKTNDTSVTPFFVINNEQMKKEIDNNKSIKNEEQRNRFYDKYLIKIK